MFQNLFDKRNIQYIYTYDIYTKVKLLKWVLLDSIIYMTTPVDRNWDRTKTSYTLNNKFK